ncbi:hypothetical protein CBOM_03026 [Ceraceosorus bombacis]|uniref:Uncharacterized protein n=1 Tax=Ceraceosorus bombacis TaxID=401625 RepID=A0A0P1BL27_9BASI|nr:hypothetical protein CBOM_03026 [Ceraceosorus bombacis]
MSRVDDAALARESIPSKRLSANGFTITWPAAFVQCEPASIGIATDGLANVLGIDITVRKGPRLDRIFIEEPISPTATIWNWTAVDVQAGTPLVLSVLAYGADNATIGAALTHALVRLPDNGPAQTECLQKKRKDEDTNRKGIGLELPLIAGILGGILLTLLVLIVFMCLRRRRERAREDAGSLQGHGRTSLLLNGAEPGSGGSTAGWGYMAAVVPGLAPRPALSPSQVQANRNNPQRLPHRWARRTHRADDGGDGELPSYGRSQWEKAKLPKYDHGNAQPEEGHAAMGCDHEAIMMMPLANHTAHQRPYGVDENAEAFDNSTAELNPEHSDQTDEQDNAGGIGTGTAIGSGISNVHRRSRSGAARPPAVRYNASRSPPQTAETFASATSQDGYDDAYDHHPAFRQAAGADGSPDRSNSQVLHSTPRSHRAF